MRGWCRQVPPDSSSGAHARTHAGRREGFNPTPADTHHDNKEEDAPNAPIPPTGRSNGFCISTGMVLAISVRWPLADGGLEAKPMTLA